MADPAEVTAYSEAQRDVATIAAADLAALWETVETRDEAVTLAKEVFPELVQKYGPISSLIASDFYGQLRAGAGVGYGFVAGLLDAAIEAEQARAVAGWGVGPLFESGVDFTVSKPTSFDLLVNGLFRLVQQYGRDTIVQAVASDPAKPRFARVPRGSHTCSFCTLLASRGAVYASSRAAGDMNKYHGFCDCQPTPIFEGETLPYDRDLLHLLYLESREQADSNSTKDILAQIRQDHGLS